MIIVVDPISFEESGDQLVGVRTEFVIAYESGKLLTGPQFAQRICCLQKKPLAQWSEGSYDDSLGPDQLFFHSVY